jgi:hypothetical protein
MMRNLSLECNSNIIIKEVHYKAHFNAPEYDWTACQTLIFMRFFFINVAMQTLLLGLIRPTS